MPRWPPRSSLCLIVLLVAIAKASDPFLSTQWTVNVPLLGAPMTTVLSADGTKIFTTDTFTVFGFDIAAQSVLWTYDLGFLGGNPIFLVPVAGKSPVGDDDVLLMASEFESAVVAVNTTTGGVLWVNTTFGLFLFGFDDPAIPLSNGGLFLASPEYGSGALVIEALTGSVRMTLPTAISIAVSGTILEMVNALEQVTVLDLAQPSSPALWTLQNVESPLNPISEKYVAACVEAVNETTGLANYTLRVFETTSGKEVYSVFCGNFLCLLYAFFPDGHRLAYAYNETSSIRIVDLAANNAVVTTSLVPIPYETAFEATPPALGNKLLVTGGSGNASLLSADGSALSFIGVPTAPSGPSAWAVTPKCVIVPNLQGYVAFSRPAGTFLHRNEAMPGIGPLYPIQGGGSAPTFATVGLGAFIGVSFPSC